MTSRGLRAAVAAAAGIAVAATAVVVLNDDATRSDAGDFPDYAVSQPGKPAACAGAVRCHDSDGVWTVVYPPESGSSQGLVLWDRGGPGLAPVDATTARLGLPDWLDGYDVAVFAEPWATTSFDGRCMRAAMTAVDGEGLPDGHREDIATRCDFEALSLSPRKYEDAYLRLAEQEGAVAGMYAQSFGAVRSTAVMHLLRRTRGWLVLDAPAAPPGTPAGRVLAARSKATAEELAQVTGCAPSDSACGARVSDRIAYLGAAEGSPNGPGEAEYEAMTGLLAMASDLESNKALLTGILTSNKPLTSSERRVLRQGSYAFTRRYGDGQALPDAVGYLAGVCPAYDGWGAGTGAPENDPLGYALTRLHRACQWGDPVRTSASQWRLPGPGERPRMLVVSNSSDPVTPPDAAAAWKAAFPNARTVVHDHPGHVSIASSDSGTAGEEVRSWITSGGHV